MPRMFTISPQSIACVRATIFDTSTQSIGSVFTLIWSRSSASATRFVRTELVITCSNDARTGTMLLAIVFRSIALTTVQIFVTSPQLMLSVFDFIKSRLVDSEAKLVMIPLFSVVSRFETTATILLKSAPKSRVLTLSHMLETVTSMVPSLFAMSVSAAWSPQYPESTTSITILSRGESTAALSLHSMVNSPIPHAGLKITG